MLLRNQSITAAAFAGLFVHFIFILRLRIFTLRVKAVQHICKVIEELVIMEKTFANLLSQVV